MLESQNLLFHWLPLLLALIAVALGALCIGQFFSFKKSLRNEIAAARDFESLEARVAHLVAGMDELRERPADRAADRPAPLPGSVGYSAGWAQEPAGVNLNRRGQVLRLRRRGRTVEEIASTLQMPRGEVELMVKVHELSQKAASAGAASSFSTDAR